MGSKGSFLWGQLSWAAVLLANGLINTHDVTMCVHGYQLVLRGGQCTKEDAMMAAFMPPSSCAGNERNENLVEGGVGVLVNVCVRACVCWTQRPAARAPMWPVLTSAAGICSSTFCDLGRSQTSSQLSYLMLQQRAAGQGLVLGHWPITHIYTHTEKERPAWAEVDSHAGNIKNYSFLFLHFL